MFVVGSQTSSNSNRLREVAEHLGVKAHLIDDAEQIDPAWLDGVERIGVTAGASAPEVLVQNVVDKLSGGQTGRVRQPDGVEENVTFALPNELQGCFRFQTLVVLLPTGIETVGKHSSACIAFSMPGTSQALPRHFPSPRRLRSSSRHQRHGRSTHPV